MRSTYLLCVAVTIACAGVAVAEPVVRNVITIPLTLPKNYLPRSVPARPLDDTLRVAVVLPIFAADRSARWTTAVEWSGGLMPKQPSDITKVDQIYINFADPVASALPRILSRLFPKTEVAQSRTKCDQCDLLLLVELNTHVFDQANGFFGSITVTGTVTAIADDVKVGIVNASGTGRATKSMYWSENTRARSVGLPALEGMLEALVTNLMVSPELEQFLKRKAAERARPSDLETLAKLDDSGSYFPNGRLDAGETARLQLTVRNQGAGPAFGVHLTLESTAKGIAFASEIEVGDMPSGGTQTIFVTIGGALDIESAVQKVRIETLEKRGYGGRPLFLELATEALRRPKLEIADISLNDSAGRGHGDGNGQPANGETVEATILVRNSGSGDAVGARMSVSSAPGVEVVSPSIDVAAIPSNTVREARVLVRVPVTFAGSQLPLNVQVEERRGAQVAQTSRSESWPLELKRPALEMTHRMYDGNSPDSRGDRDGVANNGETLDLAFVPANRGPLAARDVSFKVVSRHAEVTVSPDVFKIGDLPAFAEGVAHRARIVLPRTLGTAALLGELSLELTISQRDFAVTSQPIALKFKARRPELTADLTSMSQLVEGRPATFALEIRNRGPLAAEKVQVELTCANTAVELLEDSGAPVRKLVIPVGTVGAEAVVPRISVKAHVRRNLPETTAPLNIIVTQADFAPVTLQTALSVQREEAAVIATAAPPVAPEMPVGRASGAQAAIFFHRYQNGDRVGEATIRLSFEVHSQAALEAIRVKRNKREVDPGPSRNAQGQTTSARHYEPSVTLDYGENEIEVIAITAEGVTSNRTILINRERPQGKMWVAAVGISQYANPDVPDLAFAREDAAAVLAYYRELGVPEHQLIELLDDRATLANIKSVLGIELAKKASNPDDTVIIYFAGHGKKDADAGSVDADGFSKYLLPYDANPAELFSSALSMEDLDRILQRLRADRVVLILDSCFSGAAGGRTLLEPNITERAPMDDEFLARLAAAGKGRVILTASSSEEVAKEDARLRHGIFTYWLLQGLHGKADADADEQIDVDELYNFVSETVRKATNGAQKPMRKAPNVSGSIMLGRRMGTQ